MGTISTVGGRAGAATVSQIGVYGPPTIRARQGALVCTVDGKVWIQSGPGVAALWRRFRGDEPYETIFWMDELSPWRETSTSSSDLTATVGATETNTTVFFTHFEVKRDPLDVAGIWWPNFTAPSSGKLYIKLTIFEIQTGVIGTPGFPWKELSSVWRCKREGLDLSATVEPIWIPFENVSQGPQTLDRGRYYIAAIYGTNAGADILTNLTVKTRRLSNYSNSGTDNHFRADWTRTGGNYQTNDWGSLAYTSTSGFTGSASGSLAQCNYGIQVSL